MGTPRRIPETWYTVDARMNGNDTTLGGARRRFPDTTEGLLSRLCGPAARDYRDGIEELCRRYWKPVYRYLRIVWAKSNDDAKDLTQAFFLWLLEGEALSRYEAERGSFRHFLKMLLTRFGEHRDRALSTLKRGGAVKILPLAGEAAVDAESLADPDVADPERAFDREWLDAVAKAAVGRVRERLASEGHADQFRVYEAYDLAGPGEEPTYAEVAGRLGMKEGEVRRILFNVRIAVRGELRAELAKLTSDDRELEDEWNALFGS